MNEFARLPPEGLHLDGVHFTAELHERETARCAGALIGELDWDDAERVWIARGAGSTWLPMRSRTEARAFIVSAHRNPGRALLRCWCADDRSQA